MLELLLGQIPEAIYFALFMIFTKELKSKRILYIVLMVTEYLLLKHLIVYKISFNATVSSAATGVVAFALFNNGEQIPGTLMAETIDAAGDYANIGINKEVRVYCNGTSTISVRAVPTIPTATAPTTPITTQVPIIGSANLVIDRRC